MKTTSRRRDLGVVILATVGGASALGAVNASAQPPDQPADIVVTATRTAMNPFDVPASVDRIGQDQISDGRQQVNLSESLGGVPGLIARDRQNYAQDVQISVRGFGARSTFGIRGVRAYVDGIPATLPDGQGQVSNIDLSSADRIEILRGPFSALYGNSSGGVIQVFTEQGAGPPTLSVGATVGSDGQEHPSLKIGGSTDSFDYLASFSHFQTDGYRDHSAAQRDIGNVKLGWKLGDADKLTLVVNSVDLPEAQDPLGLTRAEFEADPRSVDPVAILFNTRKTVHQTQEGLTYEHRVNDSNNFQVLVYSGDRSTVQFQSIPVGPQASPTQPGGVIDLARNYSGLDARWTSNLSMLARPLTLVGGVTYDKLDEHRRGFQNFIGTTLGVEGALRRDENNNADSFDQYLQASWDLSKRVTLDAGLRRVSISFDSHDHYIVGPNGDDSGSADFSATLPAVGVLFALSDRVHFYVTAGRGFETPTLNELAYQPSGQGGLNLALKASTSDNTEVGVKTRLGQSGQLSAAVFQTNTADEIVTQTNSGGRSTYQNAGATRRRGTEISWSRSFATDWRSLVSYTWLDAIYKDGFYTCAGTPCTTPTRLIPSGNKIPGVPKQVIYGTVGWERPEGWRMSLEGRYLTKVFVNDLNSDAAAAYALASVSGGYQAKVGSWQLDAFVRCDNLFDRNYAGSVIVNEGNSRFFEPAPQRTWLVGLSGSVAF
jgi:iron complex outermembrane recepter protein